MSTRVFSAMALLFLLLLGAGSACPADVPPASRPVNAGAGAAGLRVLVLNSYHQNFLWTDQLVSAIERTINEQQPGADLFLEYLDSKRFVTPEAQANIRTYLSNKYGTHRPDVIIVSDDAALTFLKESRDALFPGVPVVYCGINDVAQTAGLPKDFGGIVETLDIHDNLDLARRLFPGTKIIAVITDGTPTGLGTRQEIIRASAAFPGLTFRYFNGEELTTSELLEKLRDLPAESVAIAPAWYLDKAGTVYTNSESYPLICSAAPVPVIATSAANLGLGVLGGKVNSGETQGTYAANVAVRILKNTTIPEDFTPHTQSLNAYVFDGLALRRFGVSRDLLPPGSRLINREYTFYELYARLVWGVGAFLLVLTALSVTLVLIVLRLRQARGKLAFSEENLRITLNSIGDAVIITDTQACVTGMNPVAERLTGWTIGAAHGRKLTTIYRLLDATDRQPRECPSCKVLKTGEIQALQKRLILLNRMGQESYVADSCAPIRNSAGDMIGTVLVFHDCTEEYLYEEKLRHSQKLDAIGQLAGGVAHDFNNMLGGIMGGAELLSLSLPGESPLHKHVNTIVAAAEQAAALTEKLLTFSRKGKVLSTPTDLHVPLTDALVILERSLDRNIRIVREFTADETVVIGDPAQIQNALINLGLNAGHAMPGGGTLTVSTTLTTLDEDYCRASAFHLVPGQYVRVNVRDSGTGIAPELLPHIFEPFFTTKEIGKGTGLGLSAVYGTMKEHNGCVTVFSELGAGSTFSLYFPLSNEQVLAPHRDEVIRAERGGCILVVDDEPVIRTTAHNILQELGYTVILAIDGREGLEIYQQRHAQIDLVLLDMVMPRMGGMECFHELRKVNPATRVLISSGFARDGGLQELQQLGILGFIKKPYRRAELARAVAQALRNPPAAESSPPPQQ